MFIIALILALVILAGAVHFVLVARPAIAAQRVALGQYALSRDMRKALRERGKALKGRRVLR